MINRYILSGAAFAGLLQPTFAYDVKARLDLEPLIVKHAAANNVPPALVHRIIIRESRYNARAVGRGGTLGLMQIKHGTARALGYSGSAAGLLDPDTNLSYGVRYLAGAYRVANGDQNRAIGFYARGYYYDAKRRGMHQSVIGAPVAAAEPAALTAPAPQAQQAPSVLSAVFAPPRPPELATGAVQTAVEPEPTVPARRRRSSKRRAAATPLVLTTPTQAESGAAAAVPTEIASPVVDKPRARSAPRKAPAAAALTPALKQEAAGPAGGAVEEKIPVRRSARSARPTAASGADRSGQRVFEQPADPGRRP